MPLSRYQHPDEFTSAELKLLYEHAGPNGRLALLRKLGKVGPLPEVLVQLALSDRNPRVRHALAQSNFNYFEEEAIQQLRNDSEPVVRAAACENRAFLSSMLLMRDDANLLTNLSHAERLALMRNPLIGAGLVEKIFDRSNTELSLSDQERAQLIFSYLTNKNTFDSRHLDADSYKMAGIPNYDAYDMVRTHEKHFERMWKIAAQWEWWDLKAAVYATVPASDDLKLEAYRQDKNEWVRKAIVQACKEGDLKTLTAAREDSEESITRLAWEKLPAANENKRNWSSYAWTAVVGIVEFIFSALVLLAANTRFEKLSLSLLVLTYVTVRISASGLGIAIWEQAAIAFSRYAHMLKIMRDPDYEKTREYIEQDAQEANEKLKKGATTAQIRSVILDIIGIVAIINLIKALLE